MKITAVFHLWVAPLCYLCCWLFASGNAFLEVGVSSYLQENVFHPPDTGMTLVQAWSVSARKGFFLADGVVDNAFHDIFKIPEPGIYFVALNLMITNASDGFLKASLVINDDVEATNGIEGRFGNTNFDGTLSLSGFLRLYRSDFLALYLHGSRGTLLRDSTFSVIHMSRIGSVPGFHALLSRDEVIPIQVKNRIENWRTSGTKGLFRTHSGTSPSVGLFCALLEGIHKFTSNINIQCNDTFARFVVSIVLNSNVTLLQRFSQEGQKYTMSMHGMFYLYRGDCVALQVELTSSADLTLKSGSSFSGLFLGIKSDIDPQFSVSLPTSYVTKSDVWNKMENWTVSSFRRNFISENTNLESSDGKFTSSTDGLYLVNVFVNVNATPSLHKNSVRLLVAVGDDAPSGSNGLLIAKRISTGKDSLSISGVIELDKGESVTVYLHCFNHNGLIIDGLFGVVLVSYDWPGVGATLKGNMPLNYQGLTKLTHWKANDFPGSFAFDHAFFPTEGVYRTHVDGTFFLSCNAIFKGQGKGNLSVIIAIDNNIDTGERLLSLNGNPERNVTLNVAGSMKLRQNQNVSVFVSSTEPSSWIISMETTFFVALVGSESLYVPGFFAVKDDEGRPGSSNGEIGGWRTVAPQFQSPFENNAQWNPISGRFKAKVDGLYLITANILIRHSAPSKITMNALLDGQINKRVLTTFQPLKGTGANFVETLTIAGIARLITEERLSIFITADSQGSLLKVLPNSSFSVVLISRLNSDYAAGVVAHTTTRTFNGPVYHWNTTVTKNLFKTQFDPVVIMNSGLYFLQSVIVVETNVYETIDSKVVVHSRNSDSSNSFPASLISASSGVPMVLSAFGVLYLRKGQKVSLRTGSNKPFVNAAGSWFSMARFLAPASQPGLFQTIKDVQNNSFHRNQPIIKYASTAGDQLAYIQGNVFNPKASLQCCKGEFKTTSTGTYLVSLIFTISGKVPGNVTACIGLRKCAECYVQVSFALSHHNKTYGLLALVAFAMHDLISVCFNSQVISAPVTNAKLSMQYLSELNKSVQFNHRSVSFSSSGWHELSEWKTSGGRLQSRAYVALGGLYILCTNLEMKIATAGIVGVKLKAKALSSEEFISTSSTVKADSTESISISVLAHLNASEVIAISLYTNSSSLATGDNSTFFAALLTTGNHHVCLVLRSYKTVYSAGKWWQSIQQWKAIRDQKCLSPISDANKGRFVANQAGVYFVTAVVMVKTTSAFHSSRMVELLLSVNGDTTNGTGLQATKQVRSGSYAVLSFSSTVYLEPWQTLYLMIRATGAGSFEVLEGSTFGVALIEETKYYKTVARNITQFDSGPRHIRHPPPSVSLGADLGLGVSWICEAVADGPLTYKWLKNQKSITSSQVLSLSNVQEADSGRYVCEAEYDGIRVFSRAAELDVFDTTPTFLSEEVTSPEGRNISLQLTFRAYDKQQTRANVSILITEGNTKGAFVLSRSVSKGNISLRNQIPMDYETTRLYRLKLLATNMDTNKTRTANITIVLTAINDNAPIFTNRNYTSVKENVANGTIIFQVKAVDADFGNNSIVTYSLLRGKYSGKFAIDASSGNITLIGELDHENTSEIILRIEATDGEFRTNMNLSINVTDVNDNYPYFSLSSYSVTVPENITIGFLVINVTAQDKDSGPNGQVTYSLVQGTNDTDALVSETFSVNSSNGAITTLRKIEVNASQEEYRFQVQATDNGIPNKTVSTNVTIIVTDINDNPPIFISRNYTSVKENVANGTIIFQVEAVDADFGNNSIVTYSLLRGKYSGKFAIDASSGNITLIGELDHENTSEIILRIEATDGEFRTNMNLSINVTDVNDNYPYFSLSSYSVTVPENITIGFLVINVTAQDKDSGPNGQVTYSLVQGTNDTDALVSETFSVNSSNGAITTLRKIEVNASQEEYRFQVQATDNGIPNKTVSTNVTIIVTDINDNPPIFISRNYTSVKENVANGTIIFQVEAVDADFGNNSIVTYSLLRGKYSGKFAIDASSGNITLIGELDHENASKIILRIRATDRKFFTNMTLAINVEDVNDNYPYFSLSSYSVTVPENITIGFLVINVTAQDKDSGPNGQVTYSLVQGTNDTDALVSKTFSVNSSNGAITTLKKIEVNASQEEYRFQVEATDNGIPNKTVSTNVTIIVTDINDNPPIFISRNYTSVKENVANGTIIFQVEAVDADFGNNSIVIYSLLRGKYSGKFAIDASSGNITLIGELDHENANEIILCIQATDGEFCPNMTLAINVEDVTENFDTGAITANEISAIVISILVFLVLLCLCVWFVVRRRVERYNLQQRREIYALKEVALQDTKENYLTSSTEGIFMIKG
ncbi:uncharacterized protein [Montipora capricornis]|uniref:uncharacterized protein isoform X2 n=1 Tax=Montipora capricornis TaxID=246305 RepID=UPI0035F1028E